MSFDERGRYLEMLLEQWESKSLPSTPAAIAALLGGTEAGWTKAWPKLSPCFTKRKRDGRLVNPKLEAVRRDRLRYKKSQAESGLRGAKARWKRHGEPIGSPSKPNGGAMANDGSSSSSSSSPATTTATASASAPASSAARGNGNGAAHAFDTFWDAYPRKVDRAAALTVWQGLHPGNELVSRILSALAIQRTWPQWTEDGCQFVPHPANWLKGRRWEDQAPEALAAPVSAVTRQNRANADAAKRLLRGDA